MIHDHDRSYYIGASDTKFVMGNWNTQTFRHWWDIKMGFDDDDIDNIYLRTGTMYEPKILDRFSVEDRDRQIIIGRLRVNLDGELIYNDDAELNTVVEVKTYAFDPLKIWTPPKQYVQQVQVEMFATDYNSAILIGYGVDEHDYDAVERGETLVLSNERFRSVTYQRDDDWIENKYLPRLWYLCDCLEKEKLPCMEDLHLT